MAAERQRLFFAAYFFAAVACPAVARAGSADPMFARVPFSQWFQDRGAGARINWTVSIADPLLSIHQRLVSNIEMRMDGKEVARRRGKGRLLFMMQVNDATGDAYQYHYAVDLRGIPEAAKGNDYQVMQPFFVLPGDYTVSLAVFYTATREHAAVTRKLHVPGLRNDPLAAAWRDLPAVEFLAPTQPPDTWFLPSIGGRLNLEVTPQHPLQVEVIVNMTPSDRLSGSKRMQNLNLAVLIPILKILSQVQWTDTALNVELLDLARNRVAWRQENVTDIDWAKARESIGEITPGVIDVKSLENHAHSAEFFINEISRRISAPLSAGQARAVIVLTSSVTFRGEVELHAIEGTPQPGDKIFYFRYEAPRRLVIPGSPGRGGRSGIINDIPLPSRLGPENDELEPLIKGLSPRLFEVTTPDQFRKALARTLAAVRAM